MYIGHTGHGILLDSQNQTKGKKKLKWSNMHGLRWIAKHNSYFCC